MTRNASQPKSLRRLILDNYKAAGFESVASLGRALAAARNLDARVGVRHIRRYTSAQKPSGISDQNAFALAGLLKLDPMLFEPFVTQRAAGAEAAEIEKLEARVRALESQLRALRRGLQGGQGGSG